jgi:hypothetical protein
MRTFITALVAILTLLLGMSGVAAAAKAPVDVKISGKVYFEITDPNYSQVAVSFKVTCDPALSSVPFNVHVDQGPVTGYGFVPGVPCTGKAESVVAHVQSNFGSVYVAGPASVRVSDFQNGNQFQDSVTIR